MQTLKITVKVGGFEREAYIHPDQVLMGFLVGMFATAGLMSLLAMIMIAWR